MRFFGFQTHIFANSSAPPTRGKEKPWEEKKTKAKHKEATPRRHDGGTGSRISCSEELGLTFSMKIRQEREEGRKKHCGVPKTLTLRHETLFSPRLSKHKPFRTSSNT